MKAALVRTAFSPIIYEVLDFAVALYDSASACSPRRRPADLHGAAELLRPDRGYRGRRPRALEPGDVILYNHPFGTGSHPQDAAVVAGVPGRRAGRLRRDQGALAGHRRQGPDSTDTVDMFQEGTIFPGVKLVSRGEIVPDIYRIALANRRVPKPVAGDINAELVGVKTGVRGDAGVVERYGRTISGGGGTDVRPRRVDRPRVVRAAPRRRLLGRRPARRRRRRRGPDPFDVVVAVAGSAVTIDYTDAPAHARAR